MHRNFDFCTHQSNWLSGINAAAPNCTRVMMHPALNYVYRNWQCVSNQRPFDLDMPETEPDAFGMQRVCLWERCLRAVFQMIMLQCEFPWAAYMGDRCILKSLHVWKITFTACVESFIKSIQTRTDPKGCKNWVQFWWFLIFFFGGARFGDISQSTASSIFPPEAPQNGSIYTIYPLAPRKESNAHTHTHAHIHAHTHPFPSANMLSFCHTTAWQNSSCKLSYVIIGWNVGNSLGAQSYLALE